MKTGLRKNNAGTTLAELIVTFALMGIFLASSAAIISSFVLVHSQITGTMYAQSVGETLLDEVEGELSAAKPVGGRAIVTGTVFREGENFGNGVSFYDRDENKSCFLVEDGLLVLWTETDESRWKLDENAYMGYRISEFQVNRLNERNVFEVVLKLRNLKTGFEYTASRAVQCYNFTTETDFQRIGQEEIALKDFFH